MNISEMGAKDFLSSEKADLLQKHEMLKSFNELSAYINARTSSVRRIYLFVSWLPLSKESSHIIYLLKIINYFIELGLDCRIVVSGLEFSHHRGISYYVEKEKADLQKTFAHLVDKVMPIPPEKLHFYFMVSAEKNGLDLDTVKMSIDSFILRENIGSEDVVLLTSGNLSCRYLDVIAFILQTKKIVIMTNAKDNVSRYVSWVDYVLSPSNHSSVVQRLNNSGLSNDKILLYSNIPQKFKWAELEGSLPPAEKELISELLKAGYSKLLVCASARFSDRALTVDYLKTLKDAERPDVAILMIGIETLEGPDISNFRPRQIHCLAWTKDISLLFSKLSESFQTVFVAQDASGGNTIANAVLNSIPAVVPFDSDAGPFVTDRSKYSSSSERGVIISQLLSNESFFVDVVSENKNLMKKLDVNNKMLFRQVVCND